MDMIGFRVAVYVPFSSADKIVAIGITRDRRSGVLLLAEVV
ncbi:hypothetical protein ACFZC5_08855 [Nocardia gamkensis]